MVWNRNWNSGYKRPYVSNYKKPWQRKWQPAKPMMTPYKKPFRYYKKKAQTIDGADTLVKWLKYADVITLNANEGSYASKDYRMNNVYDPDASIGGHQPMGFREYMKFYTECYVLQSYMKITCISQLTEGDDQTQIYILDAGKESDPVSWSSIGNIFETNMRHSEVAEAGNWTAQGFGRIKVNPTLGWNNWKAFKRDAVQDPEACNTTSAGPAADMTWLFKVVAEASTITADPQAVTLRVEIAYKCMFKTPMMLTPSA